MREGLSPSAAETSPEPFADVLNQREVAALQEVRDSMRQAFHELRPEVLSGVYTLIIGDDASGRLPTLLARRTLTAVAQHQGRTGPETLFFAGSRSAGANPHDIPEMSEKMEGMRREISRALQHQPAGGKVLVVTDTIRSGHSIYPLTMVLREIGVSYDIATIGLASDESTRVAALLGADIHASSAANAAIFDHPALSGLDKDVFDLHATPKTLIAHEREKMIAARKIINQYADQVAADIITSTDREPAAPT